MTVIVAACAIVFGAMIAEARLSTAHDRRLRAAGAIEPAGDVYRAMQVAYPASFAVMIVEGAGRSVTVDRAVVVGAVLFALAKALKYWAMSTLGERWTFRVLVPPGSSPTARGPYRWLRHPNYIAVVGELVGVAVAMHAIVTGAPAVAGFAALMLRRITIEDRALQQAQ